MLYHFYSVIHRHLTSEMNEIMYSNWNCSDAPMWVSPYLVIIPIYISTPPPRFSNTSYHTAKHPQSQSQSQSQYTYMHQKIQRNTDILLHICDQKQKQKEKTKAQNNRWTILSFILIWYEPWNVYDFNCIRI